MENKHKNALILVLVAVILVMAIGYAAFTQQLTINTTTTITDQKTNWNVHYDKSKTESTGAVSTTTGTGGTSAPSGKMTYDEEGLTATINATLNQPGDKVVFTLTIVNDGTIKANLGTPVVAVSGEGADEDTENPLVVKRGNIIFTVEAPSASSIASKETATMTVTAEFASNAEAVGTVTTAGITVTTNATQAA